MSATSTAFKLVSFNIDTNMFRLENGILADVFPNWTVARRVKHVLHYLEKADADIICMQELRSCLSASGSRIDSVTPVLEGLESLGYTVLMNSYNKFGGARAFKYCVAYKSVLFTSVDESLLAFTKSGQLLAPEQRSTMDEAQIKDHNFGPAFARGAFAVTFVDSAGKQFQVVNTHIDIPWKVRKESCRIIGEHFASAAIPTICVGDFNSFPDWNGDEQCDLITSTGGCDNALARFTSSFIAFPYDFGKNDMRLRKNGVLAALEELKVEEEIKSGYLNVYEKECDALGGRLDNVFHKGFAKVDADIVMTPVNYDATVPFEEAAVKAYVLEEAAKDMPAFASDHQLIEVFVEL